MATNVSNGQITSSPSPISSALCARWSAAVQLQVAIPCFAAWPLENYLSSSLVTSPMDIHLEVMVLLTALLSSSPMEMSKKGGISQSSNRLLLSACSLRIVFVPF